MNSFTAFDTNGNTFYYNALNGSITKTDSTHNTSTINSNVTAFSSECIYFYDKQNNTLNSCYAGNSSVIAIASGLNLPDYIALDSNNNIYTYNTNTCTIDMVSTFLGTVNVIDSQIALDSSQNAYFYNKYSPSINKFAKDTHSVALIDSGILVDGSIGVDKYSNVYFYDKLQHCINKYDANTTQTNSIISNIDSCVSLCADSAGDVFYYNASSNAIDEILANANIAIELISGVDASSCIALDKNENLIFYNSNTDIIERLDLSNSKTTTLATNVSNVSANNTQILTSEVYVACLDRIPDASGSTFWTNAITNGSLLANVAQGFVSSPEFNALYPVTFTNTQYVSTVYNNIFNRQPDAQGLDFWTNALNNHTLAKADLITEVIKSAMSANSASADYQSIYSKGDFATWCVNNGLHLTNAGALIAGVCDMSSEIVAKTKALAQVDSAVVIVGVVGSDFYGV